MMNATVARIQGATATDPCRAAATPDIVGKSISSVGCHKTRVGGRDVESITLTLSDGTRVMALAPSAGAVNNIGNPGVFLLIDRQDCKFVAR